MWTEIKNVARRAPEQFALDILSGVWLITLVLAMLHLPAIL